MGTHGVLVGCAYGIAVKVWLTVWMFNHFMDKIRMSLTEPVTNEVGLMLAENIHSIFELNYCVGDLLLTDKVIGKIFKSVHIMFLSFGYSMILYK